MNNEVIVFNNGFQMILMCGSKGLFPAKEVESKAKAPTKCGTWKAFSTQKKPTHSNSKCDIEQVCSHDNG